MTLEDVARLWPLTRPRLGPALQRENTVHRVDAEEGAFALRLHRPGYRTEDALSAELDWIAAMAEAGIAVPRPLATKDGALITPHGSGFASLLTWLPGQPLSAADAALQGGARRATFSALGAEMARLHIASDDWRPPVSFIRPAWDEDGLIGEAPLWGRFWEAPFLSDDDRTLMATLRRAAKDDFAAMTAPDYGLIHADLVRENVLMDGARPQFIDFDDGGWGHRGFDIATALLKHRREGDFDDLSAALIDGYRAVRPVELGTAPLFLALRAATYLGWVADRIDEPGAEARAERVTQDARWAAERYLQGR